MMSQPRAVEGNFRYNRGKILEDDNSVPDFVLDNWWWRTASRWPYVFERRVGPKILIPQAEIFEVKASNKGVYLSSNDWQVQSHMYRQSLRLAPYMKLENFVPSFHLVTTYDVRWSEKNANYALSLGFDYFHYKAQFRIVNGEYEFNFGFLNRVRSKGFK